MPGRSLPERVPTTLRETLLPEPCLTCPEVTPVRRVVCPPLITEEEVPVPRRGVELDTRFPLVDGRRRVPEGRLMLLLERRLVYTLPLLQWLPPQCPPPPGYQPPA